MFTRLKAPGCILQALKIQYGGLWGRIKLAKSENLSSAVLHNSWSKLLYPRAVQELCFRHLFLPPAALLPETQCTLAGVRNCSETAQGLKSFRSYNLASYALLVNAQEWISYDTSGATECKWRRLQFSSSQGCTPIQPLRRSWSGAFPPHL